LLIQKKLYIKINAYKSNQEDNNENEVDFGCFGHKIGISNKFIKKLTIFTYMIVLMMKI